MIGLNEYEKEMICKELNIEGIKSIILIGSRARGTETSNKGDYDLYAVLPTWITPFIYGKMKEKEKRLEHKFGAEVSVNPLTIWRIRRGKDLLLFKTKKEGITVCGKDFLPFIKIDRIEDIPADELFSYLFSSVYFLTEYFNPKDISKIENEEFIYSIAKSIIYCAETQLLMKGIYETKREDMVRRATEELDLDDDILNIVRLSQSVINGDFQCIENPIKFWFSAKRYTLLVFRQLAERFLDAKSESIEDLIEIYKRGKRSLIKNLQYSVLVWLKERKYPLFSIFTKNSIEKRLYCSLFYLMLSIEDDMDINEGYLNNSYQTLHSIQLFPKIGANSNKIKLWREVKNKIIEYWPMACGKNILGG